MRKLHNKYLQDYYESLAEQEGRKDDNITVKGSIYSTKVQTFKDFVTFLNLVKNDEIINQEWDYFRNRFNKMVKWFFNHYLQKTLPGPLPPVLNGIEIHLFDLYKLIKNLGGYLSVHFNQEFDMVGEITGLTKGNGEAIRYCYITYLEVLASHFKTARVPQKGHCGPFSQSATEAEIDFTSLGLHHHRHGEVGTQSKEAVKGKGVLEHFGVHLEGSTQFPSQSNIGEDKGHQKDYKISPTSSIKVKEEPLSRTTSDDFTVIT